MVDTSKFVDKTLVGKTEANKSKPFIADEWGKKVRKQWNTAKATMSRFGGLIK